MLSSGISDLVGRLRQRGAKRIALQFPAGLKRKAGEYARALADAGFLVIISGDPCYGACDLALETLDNADVLVHFGHAPVDNRDRVVFVPYEVDFDVTALEKALPLLKDSAVGLVTTVQHVHLLPGIEAFLKTKGVEVRVAEGSGRTPCRGQILGCCFTTARETAAAQILYVGTGLFHPIGIALSTKARVIAFDPFSGIASEVTGDTLLKKRFAVIERARNARTIGIIVSTKSGQRRMELAQRLAALSHHAVIVTMKEVSPDELLNLGFGAYVNTACPRLAYDDQVRFPVPVLSPQEFEILCGARSWDQYEIDEIP